MLLASMIENIISKLLIGFLSDRIGSLKASISMLIINMLSLILSLDETTPITETCLFGSIYSISVVGFALLTKEFFGVNQYANVYPVISFTTGISNAAAVTLIGYIFDLSSSYTSAFILSLVFYILSLSCYL